MTKQWWEIGTTGHPDSAPMVRAVAYYRHSAQDRQENSIPIQQDQVREWAGKNGVEIIHEFADAGKSGLNADGRPAFTEMMDDWVKRRSDFDYSSRHLRTLGHDVLAIKSAHVLADRHTLFLEIPELQPVNQLHLYLQVDEGEPHELFVTVHKLAPPFTEFPGYQPTNKQIARHPMLADLASLGKAAQNPWRTPIEGARSVDLPTGPNLTFARRSIRVQAGDWRFQCPNTLPQRMTSLFPLACSYVFTAEMYSDFAESFQS